MTPAYDKQNGDLHKQLMSTLNCNLIFLALIGGIYHTN